MFFVIDFDMLLISSIFRSLGYYVLLYLVRYVIIFKDLSFSMLQFSCVFILVGY